MEVPAAMIQNGPMYNGPMAPQQIGSPAEFLDPPPPYAANIGFSPAVQPVAPIMNQPIFAPSANIAPTFQYHPDLALLESNWIFKTRHDELQDCCSSKSHFEVTNEHEVLMTGERGGGGNCCGNDYEPLYFYNSITRLPMMEIVVSGQGFLSSSRGVNVNAPPGNPVGVVSRGGFLSRHFDIKDAQSGRVFICQERWSFFGGDSFPIKDAVSQIEVARVRKYGASHFTLTVSDRGVTPFQKALFLGLVILEDTLHAEERKKQRAEEARRIRELEADERRHHHHHHNPPHHNHHHNDHHHGHDHGHNHGHHHHHTHTNSH